MQLVSFQTSSDRTPSNWHLVLGKHHMNQHDLHQTTASIAKIMVHEEYDSDATSNDITLLKLASPVTLNNYINVACLPSQPTTDHEECYTTGFGDVLGKYSTGTHTPQVLVTSSVSTVYGVILTLSMLGPKQQ